MPPFAILLDQWTPPEWRLFTVCVWWPAITVLFSYFLIRWRRWLAVPSLLLAALTAHEISYQYRADLATREESRASISRTLTELQQRPTAWDHEVQLREFYEMRELDFKLRNFEEAMFLKVPPITESMTYSVWVSAIFPFVMIAVFLVPVRSTPRPAQTAREFPD
jgi:hypothetical protein